MSRVPSQSIPGMLQQTPTPPGTMRAPTGGIQRRGVAGKQPTSSEQEGK